MMSIPEAPPAGETPRSVHANPSRKRTVTVIATFLLAIAFSVAGGPTATAAPAYCKGGPPGPCPHPGWHAQQHVRTDSDHNDWCDRPGVCHW